MGTSSSKNLPTSKSSGTSNAALTTFYLRYCHLIKKSYNAHLLDKLDEESRTTVQNICRKLVDMNIKSGNIPLLQLMYNTTLPPLPTFGNISGPCSITLFQSEIHNKTIYVIGETHCSNENPVMEQCSPPATPIAKFFDTVARTSKTFLDIYVEFPPTARHGNVPAGYIGDIYRDGSQCFLDPATFGKYLATPCKTARWHFADVRFNNSYVQATIAGKIYYDLDLHALHDSQKFLRKHPKISAQLPWSILSEWCYTKGKLKKPLVDAFNNKSYPDWKYTILPGLDKLIVNKLGIPKTTFQKCKNEFTVLMVVIGALENETVKEIIFLIRHRKFQELFDLIEKQFQAITYIEKEIERSTAKDYLRQFYLDEFNKTIYKSGGMATQSAYLIEKLRNNLEFVLSSFKGATYNILVQACCLKMDTYILARIFKQFAVKKGDDQPSKPSNIITYAGDKHANNIRKFLTTGIPGFKKVAEAFNETCLPENTYAYKQRMCCLDLTDFPQPLFNASHSSY